MTTQKTHLANKRRRILKQRKCSVDTGDERWDCGQLDCVSEDYWTSYICTHNGGDCLQLLDDKLRCTGAEEGRGGLIDGND
jgi:hypothetical protein